MLKIVHPICCGMDVHKKFIVATVATTDSKGVTTYDTRNFSTFNSGLIKCKEFLASHKCNKVCMESTGKYWIPIFNILEDTCSITLAQPKYVRAIQGKKTDKKDSVWIADLFKHDLVPGSYIPCKQIRELRDLCRYYVKLTNIRSSELNRMQNSLTVSNIALASVVSDINGVSSKDIIDYLLTCDNFDVEYCKSLLQKRLKAKADEVIDSILGYKLSSEQNLKLTICRQHKEYIEECKDKLQTSIHNLAKNYSHQIELLTTIPGIQKDSAIRIIAEIGADMSVFSSSKKLCAWAGLTPQNNESAGKKKSVKISRAGCYIKPLLVQIANSAIRSNEEIYFREKYNRIKKRRGHKRAIIAISRMILTCIYYMLKNNESFNPKDSNYLDIPEHLQEKFEKQMRDQAIKILTKQGFTIIKDDVYYAT